MLSGLAQEGPRLIDCTLDRLRALCLGAGLADDLDVVTRTFAGLLAPWAETRVGRAAWPSDVSDDHTPVEFSVAITDGAAEVRALFEPHAEEPTLSARRAAGRALHERLQRDHGADLTRFRALEDLFLPEDLHGPFAVWSSVVFARGEAPTFKAYFNPQARGREHAPRLVEEALCRLGLPRAMSLLRSTSLRRGPALDELKYFALDLASTPAARVKVYVRHHEATPRELEDVSRAARGWVPGEALEFAREMCGGDRPLVARAAATCSAFTSESDDHRPAATTLYVPVCAYAHDDADARDRLRAYMARRGIDPTPYERVLRAFANRPLEDGVGMQSWVSLRTVRGRARLAVYLATEANRVYPPGTVPAPSTTPGQG
jgi:hypothetical protein